MNKSKIITLVIIIAVILIGGFVFYTGNHKVTTNQITVNKNKMTQESPTVLGNKDDLLSFSVLVGSNVSGNMAVSGIVKNGYFFEGNIGINILDINKNVLKSSHGTAITDWMTAGPVSFEGSVDFTGLQTGPAYIEIHNDNASGLPENDKNILIPVVIQ